MNSFANLSYGTEFCMTSGRERAVAPARSSQRGRRSARQSRLQGSHPQGGRVLGVTGAASPATSQSSLSHRGASASRSVCALLKWLARPVFLNIATHLASQCTRDAWGRAAQTELQVRGEHDLTHVFAGLVHRRAGWGVYDVACDGAQGQLVVERVARSHQSNSRCGWGTGREATTG